MAACTACNGNGSGLYRLPNGSTVRLPCPDCNGSGRR